MKDMRELKKNLSDPLERTRLAAVRELSKVDPADAIPALARAVGDSRDKKAINALLKLQRNDPKEEVRKEAAFALKKLPVIQ